MSDIKALAYEIIIRFIRAIAYYCFIGFLNFEFDLNSESCLIGSSNSLCFLCLRKVIFFKIVSR